MLCLCGSPKKEKSVSYALLEKAGKGAPVFTLPLTSPLPDEEKALIAFPLYFDGVPSILLSALEQLPGSVRSVYAICNCGFIEGKQTLLALEVIGDFCASTGRSFRGGMGIGAGPLMTSYRRLPVFLHPHRRALRELEELSRTAETGGDFGLRFYSPTIPKRLYMLCAHGSFRLRARRIRL